MCFPAWEPEHGEASAEALNLRGILLNCFVEKNGHWVLLHYIFFQLLENDLVDFKRDSTDELNSDFLGDIGICTVS